jgi:antibiotic biosynthesis monooxygenase (ABM) superfamily enzyme
MSNPTPAPSTTTPSTTPAAPRVGPPTKHQLALMIWLCVFPTLIVINLALGDWLRTLSPVLRTFVLATVAVPIVIYDLMPQLHKVRVRLATLSAAR